MTKQVRIENADSGTSFKVKVIVQDCGWDIENNHPDQNWKDVEVIELNYPTAMTDKYLTSTRRFIIVEST